LPTYSTISPHRGWLLPQRVPEEPFTGRPHKDHPESGSGPDSVVTGGEHLVDLGV